MALPDRQEHNGRPERGEVRKNTRIVFHGMVASPFNIEGNKPLVDAFSDALKQSSGRVVLYREAATMTPDLAKQSKVVIRHHGLIDPLLGDILRARKVPNVTQDTLDQLRQSIERAGLKSIEMGIILPTQAQDFFLSLELERLRKQRPFDVEYESHSPRIVKQISDLMSKTMHAQGTSVDLWTHGKIGLLADNQRKHHEIMRQVALLRAPDVVDDLTRLTEEVSKGNEKGVVFIPFTAANRSFVHSARRNFYENAAIDVETTSGGLEQSTEIAIHEGLKNGTHFPDELFVKDFFDHVIAATVQTHAIQRGRLTSYMQNYETAACAISAIAMSFSLGEIEEIAKTKKDVLDIVRVHPLSAPLLPFISRLLI